MRLREIADTEPQTLDEGLGSDFIDADYGYWITPEGEILNVNQREGHVPFLMDRDEFHTLSPSQPYHEWYDAALGLGWVRIIAPLANRRQMSFQFKWLTPETRRSLIRLLTGLLPYDLYVLESKDYQTFHTAREAVRFVQTVTESIGDLGTATWTKR